METSPRPKGRPMFSTCYLCESIVTVHGVGGCSACFIHWILDMFICRVVMFVFNAHERNLCHAGSTTALSELKLFYRISVADVCSIPICAIGYDIRESSLCRSSALYVLLEFHRDPTEPLSLMHATSGLTVGVCCVPSGS